MGIVVAILILALLALVVTVVSGPLRAKGRSSESQAVGVADAASAAAEETRGTEELEAAREAKYREIRDAELDFRTGKLSAEDYRAIDAELRTEAIEILNQIEAGDRGGEV